MEIKVMTFNMHHGRGIDGKLNLNRIAEMMENSEADLIGLNEVDRCFSRRSGFVDQLLWLSECLGMYSTFGPTVTLKSKQTRMLRQYGNALLSRFPIVVHRQHIFGHASAVRENRGLLEADVLIEDTLLKLYVTHLSLNPLSHRSQVNWMLKKIAGEQMPLIVMGDMNMRPGSSAWRKLAGVLSDVCRCETAAPCPTFPSLRPKLQLDYIFASRDIKVVASDTVTRNPAASDHLPLQATLVVDC